MLRGPFTGIIRHRIIGPIAFSREVSRQRRAVQLSSRRLKLSPIPSGLLRSRSGDFPAKTLFILGCGESVLGITEQNWNEVREGVSVGIGAWTIHPFVPNFLALEHVNPHSELGMANPLETLVEYSYRKALEGWHLRSEVQSVGPQILMFRPPSHFPSTRLDSLGDYGRRNAWLYGRTASSATTSDQLRSELDRYFRWASLPLIPSYLPFDTGATVTRMISLGVQAGFKDIALLGVDLRDSRYFWDANRDYLSLHGITTFVTSETAEPASHHSTESRKVIPMSGVLDVLGGFLASRLGVRLYAGHRSSWLANVLPTYPWR